VSTVEDGKQAVEEAARGGVDMVFLDVNMPVMGGPEAAAAMRAAGVQAPIIGVTASVRVEEQQRCLSAGMNAFLAKPFRRAELAAVLRAWLPSASGAAVPAAEVLDFPSAVEAYMGKEDVVRGLVKGFLDRVSARLPVVRAALERGDLEAIRFESHAIKGGALNLRARRLSEAALALERAAQEGRTAVLPVLVERFAAAADELSRFAEA